MAQDLVSLFISYSHKDEALRQELGPFLEHLNGELFEEVWHDRMIPARRAVGRRDPRPDQPC